MNTMAHLTDCSILFLLCSSCSSFVELPPHFVSTNGEDWIVPRDAASNYVIYGHPAEASASHDIPCPIDRIHVVVVRFGEESVGAPLILEGCGQRVSYDQTCELKLLREARYSKCTLILTSRVATDQRSSVPAPGGSRD